MTTSERLKAKFPDLQWQKLPHPEEHPHYLYYGFKPEKVVLPKGHTRFPDRLPLPTDILLERDQAIIMRDGIKLFADIFRPVDADASRKIPSILPWSPYGKTGTGVQQYENMAPFRAGIHLEQTSGYEKFEGPDPADWIRRGYAIVNIDARGVNHSEGDVVFWGQQEAEDIYDTVDWISKQSWSNGAVGMAGNSWLAIAQINFASRLEHPALKAIAPWEARNDIFRDSMARGGKKHNEGLHKFLLAGFAGPGSAENMPAMLTNHPLFDEYWESKYIHSENISIPMYALASYSSQIHSRASFDTFRRAKTSQKWLRVHPFFEWYDLYLPEAVNDLQLFFDRFLKVVDNGWERQTPPVRLSLLGFEADGGQSPTIRERFEQEWPLNRTSYKKLFLHTSTKKLIAEQPTSTASVSYAADDAYVTCDFTHHFDTPIEIAGYAKVRLWMSCNDHDDLDVAVQLRKISETGKLLEHLNYPCPVPVEEVPNVNPAKYLGPQGFLRASHRATKVEELSTDQEIFYQHDRRESIKPGSIIQLEITFWPMGMTFARGEGVMLRIAGHDMCYPETTRISPASSFNQNVGFHNIHSGGQFDSFLSLPFI